MLFRLKVSRYKGYLSTLFEVLIQTTKSVGVNLRIAPYNSFCWRLWDTIRPYGHGENTYFCSVEAYFSRAGTII